MRILCIILLMGVINLYGQDSLTERVDSVFSDFFENTEPGCVAIVVKNKEIVYKNAFGLAVLEHNIPISLKTVFEVGSVAKQFTGYGIALLVEKHKINLDDDIKKFIPELPDYGVRITVNDLVHHKSGIMDQYALLLYSGYRDGDVITRDDVMNAILGEKQLDFMPGEHYTYSNSNYRLLAEIIERVSQQPFAVFMKENIFMPLKMSNTAFVNDCDKVIVNSAKSYYSVDDKSYNQFTFSTCTLGSSGLWTTAEDMAKWLQNFEEIKEKHPAIFELIQQESKLNDGTPVHYGFGLEIDVYEGQKLIYHNGVNAGFNSQVYHFPEQALGIIILSNNDNLDFGLADQVASIFIEGDLKAENTVAGSDIQKQAEVAVRKEAFPLSSEEMKKNTGDFILDSGTPISFKINNSKFYRCIEGRPDEELLPLSENKFYYKDRPYVEIEFHLVSNMDVNEFDLYVHGNIVGSGNRLIKASRAELETYCGIYRHDNLNIIVSVFLDKDGQLMIKHFKYGNSKLAASDKRGLFIGTDFWINRLEFVKDKNEKTTHLKLLNPPNDRFKGVRLNKRNT